MLEAKTQLSRLIEAAHRGKDVVDAGSDPAQGCSWRIGDCIGARGLTPSRPPRPCAVALRCKGAWRVPTRLAHLGQPRRRTVPTVNMLEAKT
jgi:hypothetical protein